MRLATAPLRLTLGGGGSDLTPDGHLITATIDKYVTVIAADGFDGGYLCHYSEHEHASTPAEIKHPLIRRAVELLEVKPNIQITSIADVPAGTGLGSSGSFTVALVKALTEWDDPERIADTACAIDTTGWQDQYSAAFGGLRSYTTDTRMRLPHRRELDTHLAMFYTGHRRSAADTLPYTATNPDDVKLIANDAEEALITGDMGLFAATLNNQWRLKLAAHPSAVHLWCDSLIQGAIREGLAVAGKLMGAGDGGFLLFYTEDRDRLVESIPLRHVPFTLVGHGVR